jgi:hypothetical protein
MQSKQTRETFRMRKREDISDEAESGRQEVADEE